MHAPNGECLLIVQLCGQLHLALGVDNGRIVTVCEILLPHCPQCAELPGLVLAGKQGFEAVEPMLLGLHVVVAATEVAVEPLEQGLDVVCIDLQAGHSEEDGDDGTHIG